MGDVGEATHLLRTVLLDTERLHGLDDPRSRELRDQLSLLE
jgi:hypothetical protein